MLRFGFSEMVTSPALVYACLLPFFFPFLTSRLLAQQQRRHNWMMNARTEKPAAIHMKMNILTPILAFRFNSCTLSAAILRIMKMTVARMVATVVQRAARKVRGAIARLAQREKTATGVRKIMMKSAQAPVRKRPNIHCEAVFRMWRTVVTSTGTAIVAPDSSWLRRISTGLNQYSVFVAAQSLIPTPTLPWQKFHKPT